MVGICLKGSQSLPRLVAGDLNYLPKRKLPDNPQKNDETRFALKRAIACAVARGVHRFWRNCLQISWDLPNNIER